MKRPPEIEAKASELDELRHTIAATIGPPKNKRGMGVGMVCGAFALGVMVERWGWKPFARGVWSANRWATLLGPMISPIVGVLQARAAT